MVGILVLRLTTRALNTSFSKKSLFLGQHSWLTKLMGYDYDISYKKRKENIIADALLRVHTGELLVMAVSSVFTELMEGYKKVGRRI